MYCAKCGTQSSENDDFCRKCGAPLNRTTPAPAPTPTAQTKIEVKETMTIYCSKCGAQNAEGSIFCSKCGSAIGQPAMTQNNDVINVQIDEARHNEKIGYGISAGALILLIVVLFGAFSGVLDSRGFLYAMVFCIAFTIIGAILAVYYKINKEILIKKVK